MIGYIIEKRGVQKMKAEHGQRIWNFFGCLLFSFGLMWMISYNLFTGYDVQVISLAAGGMCTFTGLLIVTTDLLGRFMDVHKKR